ncbi:MAG TPA: hypothetical protein VKZ60_14360 [Chloroflexota bacterium]|nr:hypothetical protein [Chloroflexota bacterium]
MSDLVGVRLQRYGPVRFAQAERPLAVDAPALLATPAGQAPARVVIAADQLIHGAASLRPAGRVQPAAPAAWRALPTVGERERMALALARQQVAGRGWPVALVAAAYDPFDDRVTLEYEAHETCDTAALARELEAALGSHVVLRAARAASGLGALARLATACQELDVPPTSSTSGGVAAALLGALGARNRAYLERREQLPRLGQLLATALGPGQVIAVEVATGRVTVRLADGVEQEVAGPDWTPAPPRPPGRRRGTRAEEA